MVKTAQTFAFCRKKGNQGGLPGLTIGFFQQSLDSWRAFDFGSEKLPGRSRNGPLIPKETSMLATVAVLSNGRQKDDTKEHVHRNSPLTNCVLFPKYVFDFLHVVSFLSCGRRSKF